MQNNISYTVGNLTNTLNIRFAAETQYLKEHSRFVVNTPKPIDLESLAKTFRSEGTYDEKNHQQCTFENHVTKLLLSYTSLVNNDHVFVDVERGYSSIIYDVFMASSSKEFFKEFREAFDAYAAEVPFIKKEGFTNIKFWYNTAHGPSFTERDLETFAWKDIAMNYPHEPKEFLESIFDKDWRPRVGNQLLLWTGPPGTGKTSALRSLASEWKDWANTYYIMDPEVLLNSPDYLTTVLLREEKERNDRDENSFVEDELQLDPIAESDKWKIIIMEDASSLISKRATTENTGGLSKLLNICDGFIGQGLKIMIIITSNEEIKDLNEAIIRSGRAFGNILFPEFSYDEADNWLKEKSNGQLELCNFANVNPPYTLAKLYAALDGSDYFGDTSKKVSIGFV